MTKIDFSRLKMKNIEGNETEMDIRSLFGNMLYMQGQTIAECELGIKVYHQKEDEPLELDAEQSEIVKRYADRLPYVPRQAILENFS
jgi:hypothetical protein